MADLEQEEMPRGEDLPYDDGEPLESKRHREAMQLLIMSLEDHWADRDDFYVGGNMFFYFSAVQSKRNDLRGPDVFVVLGTDRWKERKSWVMWEEEDKAPDLVIELTSETTEKVDRGRKKQVYSVIGVETYVIYDPFSASFEVNRLDPETQRYRVVEPAPNGRYRIEGIGLDLGVWNDTVYGYKAPWLRWFDAEGMVIPIGAERATKAERDAAEANAMLTAYKARYGELDPTD